MSFSSNSKLYSSFKKKEMDLSPRSVENQKLVTGNNFKNYVTSELYT